MSADYKLGGSRNPVYSLLYLHNPVPLAYVEEFKKYFLKGRRGKEKRTKGKKKIREGASKEGKTWVTNECSQGQIINKVHYDECNIY